MTDKVCLVTGATSGIGLATALGLARQGATLILVARNRERGAAVLARIREESGSTCGQFFAADLSAQAEVRQLATDIQARYPHLDVLINNAGSFFHKRQESADGIEMTWALNVLGPVLLTRRLLPSLRASGSARVINVSSVVHRGARIHFEDLEGKKRYNRLRAYSQSKLAIVLLTYELARRLDGTGVTANVLDPGFVATGIISENASRFWRLFQSAANLVAVSPQVGAQTGIYLASSPDVARTTGRYLKGSRPVRSAPRSYDLVAAQRLWRVCLEMTGEAGSAWHPCSSTGGNGKKAL
jgi:NAD(P)-dependent dehydrogenase (short-subunit alcohol dehydrogenase family)